jgi:hypothetical protein
MSYVPASRSVTSQRQDNTVPFGQRQNSGQQEWKADAFLNFYLPSKNGGRRKIGSIPLKSGKPNEADLIAFLQEDPSRVGLVMSKIILEFNLAEPSEETGFDLTGMLPVGEAAPETPTL